MLQNLICNACLNGHYFKKGAKFTFQSRKRLYNHKCPSVSVSPKPINSLKSSSFITHPSSFSFLHSSFLHLATFKLFSLFRLVDIYIKNLKTILKQMNETMLTLQESEHYYAVRRNLLKLNYLNSIVY